MQSDAAVQFLNGRKPKIIGRPGENPEVLGLTMQGGTCPDILRLDDGSLIVIGTDVTDHYMETLPDDASCADYERIVRIPEATFQSCMDGMLEEAKLEDVK